MAQGPIQIRTGTRALNLSHVSSFLLSHDDHMDLLDVHV